MDPNARDRAREELWPNGPVNGLLEIIRIGISTTGQSAGDMDFSVHNAAIAQLSELQRNELLFILEALKPICEE